MLRGFGRLEKGLVLQEHGFLVCRLDFNYSVCQVVAATCAGSGDSSIIGVREFRMVVIDEATQSIEPSTLIPLVRSVFHQALSQPCQIFCPAAPWSWLSSRLDRRFMEQHESSHSQDLPACPSLIQVEHCPCTTLKHTVAAVSGYHGT